MTTQKARLESERSKRLQSYQKKPQPFAAVIICGFLFILGLAVGYQIGAIKRVEPKPKLLPMQAQPATKGDVQKVIDQLNSTDPLPKAKPDNVRGYRESMLIRDDVRPDRGGKGFIERIDRFAAGTPLEGKGRKFYLVAVDNGIDPRWMPAIAAYESILGKSPAAKNNFFGRKSASGGWMAYDTADAGIEDQGRYLRTQYVEKGLTTLEEINAKYAPRSHSDGNNKWASIVGGFVAAI